MKETEIADRLARIETHQENILKKLDSHDSHEKRITGLETEKNLFLKITTPIISIVSGYIGGWIGKHS